jgi:hypothetical protein
VLDLLEAGRDRLRHLALHGRDRGRIVGINPAVTTHAMGMRDMQGGAEIAVESLHLGKGEGIVERRELCRRKTLRHEGQHRWRLRQDAAIGHQRRHAAFGIDLEIVGRALLVGSKADPHCRIVGADIFQGDMRGERTGVRRVVELQHPLRLARGPARSSYGDAGSAREV